MAEQGDFYILSSSSSEDVYLFTSRLTEKAFKQGLRVHVCVENDDVLQQLDEILWTYRDGSFLPHDRLNDAEPETPITLGTPADLDARADLLINLAEQLPANLLNFTRIAEIVSAEPAPRRRSREHYRALKERGLSLSTHNIER